jgi:endonuclease/exonuclease/phosphatase family metal-dependent hydrolase
VLPLFTREPPALPDLDAPSESTREDLASLRELLKEVPPKKVDRNLLIATWNIREFGKLAPVWDQPPGKKPFRDLHAIRCIGEIVSRFDVVAIQEVQRDISALQALMHWLGSDWGLIMTDANRGYQGGGERLAFVFDTRRVRAAGLAGELVMSPEQLKTDDPDALHEQFWRTPYAVSFNSHHHTFILTTVHIRWAEKASDRTPEIHAIADWLRWWRKQTDAPRQDLLVLGDFNIDNLEGDNNYEALTSGGLFTPPQLNNLTRTVKSEDGPTYYDQIAWFERGLSLRFTGCAKTVEWKGSILADIDDEDELTHRISDHYPLWAEFAVSENEPV